MGLMSLDLNNRKESAPMSKGSDAVTGVLAIGLVLLFAAVAFMLRVVIWAGLFFLVGWAMPETSRSVLDAMGLSGLTMANLGAFVGGLTFFLSLGFRAK